MRCVAPLLRECRRLTKGGRSGTAEASVLATAITNHPIVALALLAMTVAGGGAPGKSSAGGIGRGGVSAFVPPGTFVGRSRFLRKSGLAGPHPSDPGRAFSSATLSSADPYASTVVAEHSAAGLEEGALYDSAVWAQYEVALISVVSSRRVLKKDKEKEDVETVARSLLLNAQVVPLDLPLLEATTDDREDSIIEAVSKTKTGGGSCIDVGERFREQMKQQRSAFLNATGLSLKQHELCMRALTYLGDFCAKRHTASPLRIGWEKMKEAGIVPRENSVSTYLYVLSSAASNGTAWGIGADEEDEMAGLAGEVAALHDILYKPNEKTVSLRVKSLVARGDAAGAELILDTLPGDPENGNLKKLRTYLPIVQLYCNRGDLFSALRLHKQMRESAGVIFDPDTYALLIGAIAKNGYFCCDSDPIEGSENLGYSPGFGPDLFDSLATEMADDILEINSTLALELYHAFAEGFKGRTGANGTAMTPSKDQKLEVNNNAADNGEVVVSRVVVNGTTALCPRTNATLRLIKLEKDQRREVHDALLKMATIQYEEFVERLKKKKAIKKEETDEVDIGGKELLRFSSWLDNRQGQPFTAIVDGANVAYFGHGNVHYSQLKCMVDTLEQKNERPLVIMPKKYVAPKFRVSYGSMQELTPKELDIIKNLTDDGKMYQVPAKCLDDYYWMLASVSDQTLSRNGREMDVLPNDENGRFPGLRPMLVTNDQMRDHKLELLEPRLFRRWCSCHIVNYNFTAFEEDEWEDRDIIFSQADFFSKEIQGNPTPGDGKDDSAGTAWHFPVSDWGANERFCLRIPRQV